MKKKIKFLIVALVLVVGAYIGYKYLYKDHRSIATETSVITLEAKQLQQLFISGKSGNILNKTVTVQGAITQIEGKTITLDEKVSCSFDEALDPSLQQGQLLQIKGRCIGYDDLFEIVKIDQSTITNQP